MKHKTLVVTPTESLYRYGITKKGIITLCYWKISIASIFSMCVMNYFREIHHCPYILMEVNSH